MRWASIEEKWYRFKTKAKREWSALSDEDLDRVKGDRDRLERLLMKTYGQRPDEARFAVSSWMDRVVAI